MVIENISNIASPHIRSSILINGEFLVFVATIITIFIVGLFVIKILQKYLEKLAYKTKTKLDDVFVKEISNDLMILLLIILIRYSSIRIGLKDKIYYNIIETIAIIIVGILAVKFIDFLLLLWKEKISKKIRLKEKEKIEKAFLPILNKILKALVWISVIIIGLAWWGVNVNPILGGLGLAGLAVSLAAKDTLENIFAGISLALDKSFKIGDIIELPQYNISGRIHDIGLRSTKIRSWNNELYILPNSKVAQALIKNDMYPNLNARIVIEFLVGYNSDIDKVKKIALKALKDVEHVVKDPEPSVVLVEMADFGLKFQLKFWVDSVENRYNAKITALEKLYKLLVKNKIEIPYPTHNVFLMKNSNINKKK